MMNPAKQNAFGLLILIVVFGLTEKIQEDYAESLGYWASFGVSTLGTAVIAFVVCLCVRFSWQKAMFFAITLPLTINTFKAVQGISTEKLGSLFALVAGVGVGVGVGLTVATVLTRTLRIDWNEDSQPSSGANEA